MSRRRSVSVDPLCRIVSTGNFTLKKELHRSASQPNIASTDDLKCATTAAVKKNTKKGSKKKKKFVICANLSLTKYSLVHKVCIDLGLNIVETTNNDCLLIWSDAAVPLEKIAELKSYQKINHFAGMGEICRKDSLARNIWKMQKNCPGEFSFIPQTWVLPGEYAMFQFQARELKRKKKTKTYIRKPVNGAMGHGIWLTRGPEKLNPSDTCIVQEYLDKPLLMDGFKFDLRIYALVTSCDPLKIFLYKDGLVRMGTEKYVSPSEANISNSFMHLTNYSINKHSENFIETSESNIGSKRSLTYFWDWLRENNHDPDLVWNKISDVVIKTIFVCTPHLFHTYHMCRGTDLPNTSCCFEILGFDIFMDKKLTPWVLEVNRAPSFSADQELDYEIKYGVLSSSLKLLNLRSSERKRCLKAEKVAAQKRLLGMAKKTEKSPDKVVNKKKILQKRKSDLKWRLKEIREEADIKEYEEKNKGKFVCIYPPPIKSQADHYFNILSECVKVITGRPTLRKDSNPLKELKEEEILDLLQEVENDVIHLVDSKGKLILKGSEPLTSMPTAQKSKKKVRLPATAKISPLPSPYSLNPRSSIKNTVHMPVNQTATYNATVQFINTIGEEEKLNTTFQMLLNMKIRFPGKTEVEAEKILEHIHENWTWHRPRVAAYWLVKLDATKRKKVIDIVKNNVHNILQRVWKVADIDSTSLYRLFIKLFNRLLWSHGQGLWNCFSSDFKSWESVIVKGMDQFSEIKMKCCHEVVKLCCNCLLVVYQFASESHTSTPDTHTKEAPVLANRSFVLDGNKISPRRSAGLLMGNKITKLYK